VIVGAGGPRLILFSTVPHICPVLADVGLFRFLAHDTAAVWPAGGLWLYERRSARL